MPPTSCTATDDRTLERAIADAIWREILWLMPPDRTVDIRVQGERIDVTLGPPAASEPAAVPAAA